LPPEIFSHAFPGYGGDADEIAQPMRAYLTFSFDRKAHQSNDAGQKRQLIYGAVYRAHEVAKTTSDALVDALRRRAH
jgi:hypothetical protein